MRTKTTLLICALIIGSFSQSQAQEVKKEKKIRIETIDENGNKTVIDTTLTDDGNISVMRMENGKVIIHKNGDNKEYREIMIKSDEKGQRVIHIDSDHNMLIGENVKIIDGDTVVWTSKSPEKRKMIFISEDGETAHPDHATWSMNSSEGNVIIMKTPDGKGKEQKIEVIVNTDGEKMSEKEVFYHKEGFGEGKESMNQSKYVFVKDGITISVAGSDEAKVKEVVEKIKKSVDADKAPKAPAKPAPEKAKKK